jgi:geranylgeranyl reductase family protein
VADYQVAVIGAGPSGAIAAYELAKRGVNVAIFEKHDLPRSKPCGGVVATHVDELLDFSLDPVVERKITKILITVKLGSPFLTESPQPFAYLVMRERFDTFLVDVARRTGAVVYLKSGITSLTEESDGYSLKTKDTTVRVNYIVGADGAHSTMRRLVGAPRFQRLSFAIEREIRSSSKQTAEWEDTIALDFGQIGSGYGWVFPKTNNFSVGTGGPRSVARQLPSYCTDLMAHYRERIGDEQPYSSSASNLPIRTKGEPIVYGRVLFVGDAAGLIDPLSGEGIYYAMRSGQLAAKVIAESIAHGEPQLATYQNAIDQEIQSELQIAKKLLWMLDLAPALWVPWLMKPSHPFWRYFYRVFTGEKEYRDFPKKFGVVGKLLFALLRQK